MQATIRLLPYQPAHLQALSDFSRESFLDTYAAYNTAHDMANYIAAHFNAEAWRRQLASEQSQVLLAMTQDSMAGYIHYRETVTPAPEPGQEAIQIERLYVDPGHKGSGLGRKLIRAVEGAAAMALRRTVFLGVWEKNERAIGFYQHIGYSVFGEHTFLLGEDKQRDLWLKKVLKP